MRSKGVRRAIALARWLCVAGLAIVLAAWSAPAGAQGGRWLAFDGQAAAEPDLALISAGPSAVELRATLPGVWAEEVEAGGQSYSRLYGAGYGAAVEQGLPAVPVLRREVEIPFGAQVSLELVEGSYADHSLAELGLQPIYPLQPPLAKLPGEETRAPFVVDADFYAGGSLYPTAPVTLGEQYVVRGHRIQVVEVWPVAYDPGAGTVRLYHSLTMRLQLSGSDVARTQALAERYASPAYEARLAGRVLNYNQGRPARQFAPDTPSVYLIVTADAYYNAMLPFVDMKESRGFDVTMTRCSEIAGGCLTPTNVQTYIRDAYDNWPEPPEYVLLVGDTDTIATFSGPEIGTSTDLYFGGMDAAGTGDWHPDLGRGRFPVRSAAQATSMVDKYLLYGNLTGTEAWLQKPSFPATCDQYQVAEGTHNYVINTHTQPHGFYGHFPNDPQPGGDKLYCITYGATTADVIAAANNGRWAIIFSGHGSYSSWELLGQGDIPNLTNYGMFPFVAGHACLTGNFGQTEVFGETWVLQPNKGALVYWGSSTNSFWDEDDVLERVMWDSLFSDPWGHARVAEMTDAGLAAVETAYASSAQYYWETYNVLGDPAVKLFLEPDLPTFTLGVEPDAFELCQSGTVTASVEIGSIQGYSQTVYLETGPLPDGVSATLSPSSAPAPFVATLTLEVAPGTAAGDYGVVVTATDQVDLALDKTVNLTVVEGTPATPALVSPADGAADQSFTPTLDWSDTPFAAGYRLQLDRSPLFAAPLIDETGLADSQFGVASALDGGRCYWWRAAGDNACGEGPWADPFHFSTVALAASFYDDMEAGAGLWSHQAAQGVDHWALSTQTSHSPTHSWFVPDDAVVTDSRLWTTTPVEVGAGSALTFWHRYAFEGTAYDGAVLEISIDGGTTWTDLGEHITANGYNGTISTCCSNPLGGRAGWTGDVGDWTAVEVDLSTFAGQDAMFRWRLGCDSSIADTGWYIDDVQITAPMPPNPTPGLLSITPSSGSAFAPTDVVVEGSNLLDVPSLRLGDTWLEAVTLVNSTTVEAVVPAGMEPGVYDLTLYNGDCQEAVLPASYTVFAECITPSVTLDSDSPVEMGSPVHLTAVVSASAPVSFAWEFGGAGQAGGELTATPEFTYTMAGIYTVTVTITDACDVTATAGTRVEVEAVRLYVYLPVVLK